MSDRDIINRLLFSTVATALVAPLGFLAGALASEWLTGSNQVARAWDACFWATAGWLAFAVATIKRLLELRGER